MSLNGLLLVNKPKGWTSFDIVAKTRNILRSETGKKVKVGHTGTLDPMAEGLLVLLIGTYCKRADEFTKLDKTYQVELKLGENSSTGDAEGEKALISDKMPEDQEVIDAVNSFVGEIEQIPPAYSAIKINGQRAYKLARAGKQVKIEPRKVSIYSIKDINYSYPNINFTCRVSSGTYIRSLAEDIGKKLGTGAYMSALNRTQVGDFLLSDAEQIDKINIDKIIEI